jgi:dolichol-phosphate mannosyltransferase
MAKSKKVVILLPTFNEKGTVAAFIKDIFKEERKSPGWKYEILIVDDVNSKKENKEYVKDLAKNDSRVHFLENEPTGLGVAIIQGHRYAIEKLNPDALAQLDADGQVEAEIMPKLLAALDEGYDLAIGSRFVKGGKNLLSPSRQFFSAASSVVSRIIMGPWNIQEWSNSARAFTPSLFRKINLDRVPWMEKSFIIQPSFLKAAIVAGAKYKEVPLVFKNRSEGYSKMKIFSYSYDVISYAIDARLHSWGINYDFFGFTRKVRLFLKFGTVGFLGTIIDFALYKFFIHLGLVPGIAKIFSAEIAVVSNFIFNNAWTFKGRNRNTPLWQRFVMYNLVSSGGILMAGGIVGGLHALYGDGFLHIGPFKFAYNTIYFLATIPPVMTWNFLANHFITWRHKEEQINVV